MYTLEEGRHGQDWQVYDNLDDFQSDDIEDWIAYAKRQETLGIYHFRLLDSDSNVVWTNTIPNEGAAINLCTPPEVWLESIRVDYNIEKMLFTRACMAWVERCGGDEQ
jgi:hypothetical protein